MAGGLVQGLREIYLAEVYCNSQLLKILLSGGATAQPFEEA